MTWTCSGVGPKRKNRSCLLEGLTNPGVAGSRGPTSASGLLDLLSIFDLGMVSDGMGNFPIR